jgi:hypothetical protein
MILVIDVGNTHIKIGLYEGDRMAQYWRMATNRSYTSDEYGTKLETMFNHSQTPLNTVHGIIISSVVPTVNYTIEHMCRDFYGITPIFVGPGIKTGLNLRYEDPRLEPTVSATQLPPPPFTGRRASPWTLARPPATIASAGKTPFWAAAFPRACGWQARPWSTTPPACLCMN